MHTRAAPQGGWAWLREWGARLAVVGAVGGPATYLLSAAVSGQNRLTTQDADHTQVQRNTFAIRDSLVRRSEFDSLRFAVRMNGDSATSDRKLLRYTACLVTGQSDRACAGKYLTGMERP